MNDLDDQLADALERLAGSAPHHPDLAGAVRRRHRAQRRQLTVGFGVAVASAVAVLVVLLMVPGGPFRGSHDVSQVAVGVAAPCQSRLTNAVLPIWARSGFSEPRPVMPFVRSASGNVVAIQFNDKLSSPPRPDVANKVLWVWHRLPADITKLHAGARLNGTGPVVTTGLPTPLGPSYVDLPAPGCWRLTLSWPGGSDTIDLRVLPVQEAERRP